LLEHPKELLAQTRAHIPLLAQAGVISDELRDAALAISVLAAGAAEPDTDAHLLARRRAGPVRARLAGLLGTRGFYELDRLDLGVESTVDERTQDLLSDRVERLRDPDAAAAAGLIGLRLLEPGTADGVKFSLNLYERGADAHRLRAQVDNSEGALDLSDGVKLDLGSTAKLRTLVTYLEVVAGIHAQLAALPVAQRSALELPPTDRLGRWVQQQLQARPELSQGELLEAALERRYSASPGAAFFTGGGLHHFSNFDKEDNARRPSVREGLQRSVNLVFVRVLLDIVDHVMASQLDSDAILAAPADDSRRRAYLWLFAHSEGSVYLTQGYAQLAGHAPEEALARLYRNRKPTPKAAAVAVRAADPDADLERFTARLAVLVPTAGLSGELIAALYAQADPARWSLQDQGYLAKVHPLELWLLAHLHEHPEATLAEVIDASRGARLDAYRWLFRSERRRAQNSRIRTMLEREAFARIHAQWQATGYPFPSLVPSLATALGTSADRPTALAELMGILASDGIRVPIRRIESLRFASDTPYETLVAPAAVEPERVLRPEVCAAVRRALVATVEGGTAQRARGALHHADGSPVVVGGKTGTGDHRFKVFARGQHVLEERPVSRSATFVFLIDDRFFGVVTAVVTGPEAGRYHFTSSLPVQLFTALMPEVLPVLEGASETPALAAR
jgi:membrane peptidoglycan carboxypeptidase